MSMIDLKAPLSGWAAPLAETPDPVFGEKMMGDGVAVDPVSSTLCAPCDGVVISVHRAGHALTLRAANGAEILMHVGLETVALNGEGFERHVADGQQVKAGDRLLSFDLDLLAGKAKSLITPIVVANSDDFEIVRRTEGREVAQGEALFSVKAKSDVQPIGVQAQTGTAETVLKVVVVLEHGIHARPAAAVAACVRRFAAEVKVETAEKSSDARSVVGLMTLGVRKGEEIVVRGRGQDGALAAAAVAELLEGGFKEEAASAPKSAAKPAKADDGDPRLLRAVAGAPGLAVGRAVWFRAAEIAVPEAGDGAEFERLALAEARYEARSRLEKAAHGGDRHRRDILEAHCAILDDPELIAASGREIDQGLSAGLAWRKAIRANVAVLQTLEDPRMKERASDLLDVERQVLGVLYGGEPAAGPALPDEAIVLAEELLPSELASLDASRLVGLCTAAGGPTSHVAILAASMGVPALVAAGARIEEIVEGQPLILDADRGELHLKPEPWEVDAMRAALAARWKRAEADLSSAHEPAVTTDGRRVDVHANLGAAVEAAKAVAQGAEGCGLLRTEFLFLERETAPDEDEQHAQYQAVVDGLDGRPLVIRTLDAGGDKPLAYLPMPHEENPALGLRGVRTSLWRPDLLRTQLRAILRVKPLGVCSIMLPMVASVAELRTVRTALQAAAAELGVTATPPLGLMIETPASAFLSDALAKEADFFSIGTNDLTQYVLAMDRTNAQLAAEADALHPAVLRAIAQTCKGAQAHATPVAVCGGLASDPLAAPLLIGLGVSKLSVTPAVAPRIKAVVRSLDSKTCQAGAQAALDLDSAAAVRALVRERWPQLADITLPQGGDK